MLTQIILLGDKTTKFKLTCEKSGKKFERIKKIKSGEKRAAISNTEIVFCDEEIAKFKEWMRDKGYLKTDCWCKHIEEFKNGMV